MEQLTDEDIMMAVKGGQTQELAILYEKHKRRFYNYFVKMTMNRELSQDLLQNLFVRILKYKHSYQTAQPFLPWCYRMARNMAYDAAKREAGTADRLSIENVAGQLVDLSVSAEEIEKEKLLMIAIARLPESKRELIIWSKIEGQRYESIARIRDTTVGAIKVQVHRAMEALRKIYFEVYESNV